MGEPLCHFVPLLQYSTKTIHQSETDCGIKDFGAEMVEICVKASEKQNIYSAPRELVRHLSFAGLGDAGRVDSDAQKSVEGCGVVGEICQKW
jgi:hypothetical protein